jgi:hypothetical protein
MTDLPEDWVLIEAARRGGFNPDLRSLRSMYAGDGLWKATFRALCDMIAKHEQKPVDRKLLCAREAIAQSHNHERSYPSNICRWQWIAIRTIELWEEGYGK